MHLIVLRPLLLILFLDFQVYEIVIFHESSLQSNLPKGSFIILPPSVPITEVHLQFLNIFQVL